MDGVELFSVDFNKLRADEKVRLLVSRGWDLEAIGDELELKPFTVKRYAEGGIGSKKTPEEVRARRIAYQAQYREKNRGLPETKAKQAEYARKYQAKKRALAMERREEALRRWKQANGHHLISP